MHDKCCKNTEAEINLGVLCAECLSPDTEFKRFKVWEIGYIKVMFCFLFFVCNTKPKQKQKTNIKKK